MRAAGLVVARTLAVLREAVAPGVSTADLDELAERGDRAAGATPSFKGYHGYPASICTSVNQATATASPARTRYWPRGIISIDCGAIVDGWHGDAALTVGVGEIAPELTLEELLKVCETALWQGLARAQPWPPPHPTSPTRSRRPCAAPARTGSSRNTSATGSAAPWTWIWPVPNYGLGRGPRLREGMAVAIEPMIVPCRRDPGVADEWTVVSADGSYAAHYEKYIVAITADGPWVLTAEDGGAAGFAAIGQPSVAAKAPRHSQKRGSAARPRPGPPGPQATGGPPGPGWRVR